MPKQIPFDQMLCSRFPTVKTEPGEDVPISNYFAESRSEKWRAEIEKILAVKDEAAQQRKKAQLLAAYTLSGTFSTLHSKNGLIAHSGILVMDFDHLAAQGFVPAELRDKIAADPHVYGAAISPRRDGVKALVRIIASAEYHEMSFFQARNYFAEKYGVTADKTGKDYSRPCYVTHDPDLKINPGAIVLSHQEFEFSDNGAHEISLPLPSWPPDSIYEDLMAYARKVSEADDSILIGSSIPILPAVLGRKIHFVLDEELYPNLFSIVVTPSGYRKTTSIKITKRIFNKILAPDKMLNGFYSVQSLWDEFCAGPTDKIWVQDDANAVLHNWAFDAAGKNIPNCLLERYDCSWPWSQSYRKQKSQAGGSGSQQVGENSLTLLFGSTFVTARLPAISCEQGLRSRFLYYVSERIPGSIIAPAKFNCPEMTAILDRLKLLLSPAFSGEVKFSGEADTLYRKIKSDSHREIMAIRGHTAERDLVRSSLSRRCGKIIKLAMIFETARWVNNPARDWRVIAPDTLQMAADHEAACFAAGLYLDRAINRDEIDQKADAVIAVIRSGKLGKSGPGGYYRLTKTQLTTEFAKYPGRVTSLKPSELYEQVIPRLIARGEAAGPKKIGFREFYGFKGE
jgi:hypothetical protein